MPISRYAGRPQCVRVTHDMDASLQVEMNAAVMSIANYMMNRDDLEVDHPCKIAATSLLEEKKTVVSTPLAQLNSIPPHSNRKGRSVKKGIRKKLH